MYQFPRLSPAGSIPSRRGLFHTNKKGFECQSLIRKICARRQYSSRRCELRRGHSQIRGQIPTPKGQWRRQILSPLRRWMEKTCACDKLRQCVVARVGENSANITFLEYLNYPGAYVEEYATWSHRMMALTFSSIDMSNNDVGKESAQKFMKQTGDLKAATLYFAS